LARIIYEKPEEILKMELRESPDRWVKKGNNYERYQNVEECAEVEDHSSLTYQLPVTKSRKKNGLMLQLDACDGQWLIAASEKKYIPVAVAPSVEAARTALSQIQHHQSPGYIVVSDENDVPFQNDLFDFVWKFSPCIFNDTNEAETFAEAISRAMAKSGMLKIAFDSNAIRSHHINGHHKLNGNGNSSTKDLFHKNTFSRHFANVHTTIRGSHMHTNTSKRKIAQMTSQAMSVLSNYVPAISRFSDSVFINARKEKGSPNFRIHHFLKHHWLRQNLNVVYLLQCPLSGGPVYLSKDANFVISDRGKVKYPIINEVPIMLKAAAVDIEHPVSNQEFKIKA
jgi:uncharacterized protein YbaR (Trm112 family)